jgi:hypothetical protein
LPIYAIPLIGLVALLLQPKKNFKLALPAKTESAINKLKIILDKQEYKSIAFQVLEILLALWTQFWPKSDEGHTTDPTIGYIALSTQCRDGSFLEAN